MRFALRSLALLLLLSLPAFDGCRRKPQQGGSVVLYVSVDQQVARDIINRFQQETGIEVNVVGDTEVKKTTGLVERLRSEKANPQADVLWSSEIVQTISLAEDGILDEHLSEATKDWPRDLRDGQRRWFAFAARPRVIVFSPQRVKEDQRPATWMDLTQRRWRGKIAIADPRFGTTGDHLGAMLAYWDREIMPGYFRAWAEGIAANNVRLLPSGNAGVVEAVASGEADVGMTDADDVWAAKARGLDVDLIYPDHALHEGEGPSKEGIGTLLTPNTVARVKGGPNPEQAKALIDFLLSEQVERALAESDAHNVPMRYASLRESFAQYAVPDPLRIDLEKAAAQRDNAIAEFFAAMEAVKQERAAAAEPERPAASEPESQSDQTQTTKPGEQRDGGR